MPDTIPDIKIVFDETGRIDVKRLETFVTKRFVTDWMRDRLQGRDPYVPITVADEEHFISPERLFIDLWEQAQTDSNQVTACLEKACLHLLREAYETPDQEWVRSLLHLISVARPSKCRWFFEEHLPRHERKVTADWINAFAAYPPDRAKSYWVALLSTEHRMIAYNALAQDPELAVQYLHELYRQLPENMRLLILPRVLRRIMEEGTAPGWGRLCRYIDDMAQIPGMLATVNRILEDLHEPTLPDVPVDTLGDLLKKKADQLNDNTNQRREVFRLYMNEHLKLLHDVYPDWDSQERDLILQANQKCWPDWAVECLPKLYVRVERTKEDSYRGYLWYRLALCILEDEDKYKIQDKICNGLFLLAEIGNQADLYIRSKAAPKFERYMNQPYYQFQTPCIGAEMHIFTELERESEAEKDQERAKRAHRELLQSVGFTSISSR